MKCCLRRLTRPLLLVARHGVGDAVMVTSVLLHLRHYGLEADVWCRRGQHSLFDGLCRRTYLLYEQQPPLRAYSRVIELPLGAECGRSYSDSPATKAEMIVRDVLRLPVVEGLCRYEVYARSEVCSRAAKRMAELAGGRPAALLHYQGSSGRVVKDLAEPVLDAVCCEIAAQGAMPIVLDAGRAAGVVPKRLAVGIHDDDPLWGGEGFDGATIAALAKQARFCLGIDSGPGHIFGAVNVGTPTVIVWPSRLLHPLHYFALADHVLHVVPPRHADGIRGVKSIGRQYFASRYRRHVCRRHYRDELAEVVSRELQASLVDTSKARIACA